jgi:hypothetical protein
MGAVFGIDLHTTASPPPQRAPVIEHPPVHGRGQVRQRDPHTQRSLAVQVEPHRLRAILSIGQTQTSTHCHPDKPGVVRLNELVEIGHDQNEVKPDRSTSVSV